MYIGSIYANNLNCLLKGLICHRYEPSSFWMCCSIKLGEKVFIFILRISGNKFSHCKIKQAGAELC